MHGPHVRRSRLVELGPLPAGLRRVQLPVQDGGCDRCWPLAGEPCEAIDARVGEAACHGVFAPDAALHHTSIPDFWLVLRRRLCHTASQTGYPEARSSYTGSRYPSTRRASHDTDGSSRIAPALDVVQDWDRGEEWVMAELPRLNGIIKALEEGDVAFVGAAPADGAAGTNAPYDGALF